MSCAPGPGPDKDRPFPTSQCHQCALHDLIPGKNSTFIICKVLPKKYQRQPVQNCPAFDPLDSNKQQS